MRRADALGSNHGLLVLPRRRRLATAGLVVFLAVLVLIWWRKESAGQLGREPAWEITLHSNQGEGTPWSPFDLEARRHVLRSDVLLSSQGFHWRWQVDDVDLPEESPVLTWRSGALGSHRLSVTATSAKGVQKSAQIDVLVREVPDKNRFPRDPPPPTSVTEVPFGFAEVTVEPSEVCVGEPAAIRAKATAKNGHPGTLVTTIDGLIGSTGSFFSLGGEPGMRRVTLQLRDPDLPGKYAETEVYVELKDCFAPATMLVEKVADPSIVDRYAFRAKLLRVTPDRLAELPPAASYSWDFGDAHKEVSSDAVYAHTFPSEGERPDDERGHSYLVAVEALDGEGRPLAKAYSTVYIENIHRMSKGKGRLELIVHYKDLAETSPEGDQSFAVALENIDTTETVQLTQATRQDIPCGANDTMPPETTVDVGSLFPRLVIGPKETVGGRLTVTDASERKICRVAVTVTGKSTPGSLDVRGGFSVTVGNGPGFRQEVSDPKKLEAIRTVVRLTGKTSFTDEDIRKLEDQGEIPKGVLAKDPLPTPPGTP